MQDSKLTIKGQTTLPRDVRMALDLQPGDKVRYLILERGEVRIARAAPVIGLSGALKDAVSKPVSLKEMEAAIEAEASGT